MVHTDHEYVRLSRYDLQNVKEFVPVINSPIIADEYKKLMLSPTGKNSELLLNWCNDSIHKVAEKIGMKPRLYYQVIYNKVENLSPVDKNEMLTMRGTEGINVQNILKHPVLAHSLVGTILTELHKI